MTTAQKQARIRELSEEYRRIKMTTPTETSPKPGAVVVSAGQHALARPSQWTNKETDLVASAMAPGLRGDGDALRAFAAVCRHTQLDPFAKQIYAWKDGGKLTIHIAINGWRAIASRTGEYAGQDGPYWCGEDGVWRDVWISDKAPVAARVGVKRRGFDAPVYSVATWKEFGRPKVPIWQEKGAHMLAKCAEYNALQRSFPEAFDAVVSGLGLANPGVSVASSPGAVPDNLDTEAGRFLDAPASEAAETMTGSASDREGADAPNTPAPSQEPGEVSAPERAPAAAPQQTATVPSGDGSPSVGAESGAPPDAVAELPLPANANADGATEWWTALQGGAKALGLTDEHMRGALAGVYSCSNAIGWCRSHHTTAAGLLARAKEISQLK